jgi:hypothetical protein
MEELCIVLQERTSPDLLISCSDKLEPQRGPSPVTIFGQIEMPTED